MLAFSDIYPGVKHSVLRQMGEGLLSVRTGAGAPVAKALYRGGKSSGLIATLLFEICHCIVVIMVLRVCVCR